MKRPSAASRSGTGEMMHPANCAAACSIKSSYSLTRHPHRVHSRACRRADDEHAPATRNLLFTRPAVDAVATQVNFVRHDPSPTRSFQADERRRTKRSDRVSGDPNGSLSVGPRGSGLELCALSRMAVRCNFLDNVTDILMETIKQLYKESRTL